MSAMSRISGASAARTRARRRRSAVVAIVASGIAGASGLVALADSRPADAPLTVTLHDTARGMCVDGAVRAWHRPRERACDGSPGQEWTLDPVAGAAPGRAVVVNAASGLVLDAAREATTPGSDVIMYPRHGRSNQQWVLPAPGVPGAVENMHSHLVVGVAGVTGAAGAGELVQVRRRDPRAGAWSVVPVGAAPAPRPSTAATPTPAPSARPTSPSAPSAGSSPASPTSAPSGPPSGGAAGAAAPVRFPGDYGVVDVTKAPYFAKGDGTTDDTTALRKAVRDNVGSNRTLYLPDGTYLVRSGLSWQDAKGTWGAFLGIQGQSEHGTVIKLADGVATDPAHPLTVVRTASMNDHGDGRGNEAFDNYLSDLTVDTGRGNPGAVGVSYLASNEGSVRDVTIRSGDPAHVGVSGLDLTQEWPGPALVKNLTVEGFDTGIDVTHYIAGMTFEHVRLAHQRTVGVNNRINVLWFRDLHSTNTVPAVSNGGSMVLVDSALTGGAPGAAAVTSTDSLYARNVSVDGYGTAIRDHGRDVPGPRVEEFTSAATPKLFPGATSGLDLPVRETPHVAEDPDPATWTSVTAFGAKPDDDQDDTAAIQAAIDSGARTVYFPYGDYRVSDTIHVRGAVTVLRGNARLLPADTNAFGDAAAPRPVLRVETPAGAPSLTVLRLEFGFGGGHPTPGAVGIEDASAAPLSLRDVSLYAQGGAYRNTPGAGPLFVEDVTSQDHRSSRWVIDHQDAWMRQINPEVQDGPMITNRGGRLWILGMKTEDPATVLHTTDGGATELLGGLSISVGNPPADRPALVTDGGSRTSASYVTSANPSPGYHTAAVETGNGTTKTLPTHGGGANLPLYVATP